MRAPRLSIGLGSLVVALTLVVAVGVGSAIAVIPNGNGKYFACLVKSTGTVRLIDYPKVTCAKGEKLIKWNAKGPQGPAGPQGPTGPSGSSNWGDIGNKPADLADGQVSWGEVTGKPAGFADGEDDAGYTSALGPAVVFVAGAEGTTPGGTHSRNVELRFAVIPQTPSAQFEITGVLVTDNGDGTLTYQVRVKNWSAFTATAKLRATTFNTGITPAALKRSLKADGSALSIIKKKRR